MNVVRAHAVKALAALLALVPGALAQQKSVPRIGYVYPAGGQQGSTFEIVIGGQYMTGITNVFVSGTGVQARIVEYTRPLTNKELNDLRTKQDELQKKRQEAGKSKDRRSDKDKSKTAPADDGKPTWTPADEKLLAEIRKKIATAIRKPANPAIAETAKIQITTSPTADLGEREIRLGSQNALSNPLVFNIGQLPEVQEKAAKPQPDKKYGRDQRTGTTDDEMKITLPAVVNGQILPGDVDRYRFTARKGQRLTVAVQARQLIPYLPDAVPGWFQATVAIHDAKGNELVYDDDFRFNPDPVLFYQIPADGEYVIKIKDSIYRGREDFVYRITVGEMPFLTDIFPLGGRVNAQTTLETKGWNLATARVTTDARGRSPGIYPISVRKEDKVSNRVLFAVDTLPEAMEQEPNNDPKSAQPVAPGLIINGRIDQPGDWDVYRFEGGGGVEVVAEVYARRLNSPVDSIIKLTDATGKQIAANDDYEDKGSGLTTHHADSYFRAKLPATGTYYLAIGDTQQKGGAEYAYRLRISPPQPDFELRVVPSTLNARSGSSVPVTVYALRKDGFEGEIAVALKDAPEGFRLSGGSVPAKADQAKLTLTAVPNPKGEPVSLTVEGRATIQGREVVHAAVPAEDMMQAFAYRHLVPTKELIVHAAGRYTPRASMKILSKTPVQIPAGGTARVKVDVPSKTPTGKVQLELSEAPAGIAIKNYWASKEGMEIVLQSDAGKVKPGQKGNLIVKAYVTKSQKPEPGKPASAAKRTPQATLPAIPFEIVRQ